MASVHQREQSRGQLGESGVFDRADPLEGAEQAGNAAPSSAALDPVLRAFGEVRSLNTQLQGANDALHTVNEALRTKVEQLRVTALDLEQMLDGLHVGIVLLDGDLGLRRFNARAGDLLGLEEADVGGAISATCRGRGPELAEWCREVLRSDEPVRRALPSALGEPLSLQARRSRVDGELRLTLVLGETLESQ